MPWPGEPLHDTCEVCILHYSWEVMSGFHDSLVMSFLPEVAVKYAYNRLCFFKLPQMVLTCCSSHIHIKIG